MDDGWIVWDQDYCRIPIAEIGGKAKGLGAILGQSARCPPSFCLTTSALRHCVASSAHAHHRPEDLPEIVSGLAFPSDLVGEISTQVITLPRDEDGRLSLAVRSSFVTEDTPEAISPGIYYSEVGVTSVEDACGAILRVWASAFTPEALAYRQSNGLPLYELGMAVIVQHAPTPVVGGVAYSLLPGTGDVTALLVEFAEGSPVNVVENRVEVTSRVVNKRTRKMAGLPCGSFRADQADELIAWSLKLERAYDSPLDIEWLVDERDTLWLLQARRLPFPEMHASSGRFVADARATTLNSAKLVPFQLAGRAAINTVTASLILPAAFAAFKRSGGEVSPDLDAACRPLFQAYLRLGPVSIRSAYWSALDSGDLMPQSGTLGTVDDCLAYVTGFWRFIIDNGLDDYTAEVALLTCNWTDLRASAIASVPASPDGTEATVAALYGQLDGLESCAHDVYRIELTDLALRQNVVPEKRRAVRMPGSPPEPVPAELWQVPVLDPGEITSVGQNLRTIQGAFGAARVEFLVLNGKGSGDDRVVVWQISPLTPAEAKLQYFRVIPLGDILPSEAIIGELIPVSGPQDIQRLLKQPTGKLAYIDFTHSSFRDQGLANAMALELKRLSCPVLLKGSLLSHFAALLRDYGVTVYPVLESLDDIPAMSSVTVTPLT